MAAAPTSSTRESVSSTRESGFRAEMQSDRKMPARVKNTVFHYVIKGFHGTNVSVCVISE